MRKKVLFVITKNNFGGAQRYVYDLAVNLPTKQFEICVAFGSAGESHKDSITLEEKLRKKKIRTVRIQNFCRDISLKHEVLVFFELLRIVQKEKPDVLHVTSSKAGGIGTLIGRLLGIQRIIFTSHGLAYDETWRPAWQQNTIKFFTWLTILLSHKTIQITKDTTKRTNALPLLRDKNVLIHNGRTTPAFVSREEARKKLIPGGVRNGDLWIGAISELTKNKNIDSLIRALSILHERGHSLHLVVCSEGEERPALIALTKEKGLERYVHLVGYVKHAARYLPAFDIYTLPSHKEGLPYVLMEAGFASLPVIASNIRGITDLVEHEQTGLLTETDPESIANNIEKLVQNPKLRKKYGSALFNHIHTNFSIKRMVEETTKLY